MAGLPGELPQAEQEQLAQQLTAQADPGGAAPRLHPAVWEGPQRPYDPTLLLPLSPTPTRLLPTNVPGTDGPAFLESFVLPHPPWALSKHCPSALSAPQLLSPGKKPSLNIACSGHFDGALSTWPLPLPQHSPRGVATICQGRRRLYLIEL